MARPPDLEREWTAAQLEVLFDAIRRAASLKDACAVAGIKYDTALHWQTKGKKEGALPCYAQFVQDLDRARAEGNNTRLGILNVAARGEPVLDKKGRLVGYRNVDVKALKFLLAISDPEHYSERRLYEHTGRGGKPIEVRQFSAVNLPATETEGD